MTQRRSCTESSPQFWRASQADQLFLLKFDEHKQQQQQQQQQSEESFMKETMDTFVLAHHHEVNCHCGSLQSTNRGLFQGRTTITTAAAMDPQHNPLATPILLAALQGVSCLEQQAATTRSKEDFTNKGQYLCTCYDYLYTYYEPCSICKAIACVHSRL
jgi:hypothetical protein